MSSNLKNYQQEVRHLISFFKAFNISYVPRVHNASVDTLSNATIRLSPLKDVFSIEIIYKPSMLNNVTKFCVFNDERQILHFMANANVFKDVSIE